MNIFEIFNFAKKEQYQLFDTPAVIKTLEDLEDKTSNHLQHLSIVNDSVTNETRLYLAPKLKEIWLNIPLLCEAFPLVKENRSRIKNLLENFLRLVRMFLNKLRPTHRATIKEVSRWLHDIERDLKNLK
ncbi:MAG: hypothetical protein KGO93_07600 [Cyanobacteria bacterium REEB446]|nr:hypothetical protein [Cyanobacteria bacterium REEB446]